MFSKSINVPFDETCKIVLDKISSRIDDLYIGYNIIYSTKMLENCTKNNLFLLNEQTYLQIDGYTEGGCVSSALANIFHSHHETTWLDNCPSEFKPVLYKRYVDDIFLLFRQHFHVRLFFYYVDSLHTRIKFTCEV